MSRQGQNIGRTKRTTYDPVPLGTERFVPTGRYTLLDIRIATNIWSLRDRLITGRISMSRQGQHIGRKKCKMIVFHVPSGTEYR